MRHARARAQARVQALPHNFNLTLWSIGTLLSAAVFYLALVK
jgi:hypothetical protein